MLKLYRPDIEFRSAFYRMAFDYKNSSDTDKRYYKEIIKRQFDYEKYIRELHNHSRGVGLPEGLTPYDTYWMMDDGRQFILAVSRLRHRLNERSIHEGGHIGYDVPPSQRNKGYATELLRLTLVKAADYCIRKVLLTCDFDNEWSARVILKNGGIFENQVKSDYSGKMVNRYWIDMG